MHSAGRSICAFVLCLLLSYVPFSDAQQPAAPQPATSSASHQLVLEKGTPVKLRFKRDLSSAGAKPGDNVDFEVVNEVKVGDIVVIPKGNAAVGKVTVVEAARRMGRGGKLDIEIDDVTLADGEKASLWAVKEDSGEGNVGDNRPIVARSLVFGPVAPLILVMEGEDAMIPRDTEITGYVVDTRQLDPAKFPTISNLAAVLLDSDWRRVGNHLGSFSRENLGRWRTGGLDAVENCACTRPPHHHRFQGRLQEMGAHT